MSNEKFIEASTKERFAFNQFITTYNLFQEKDDYSLYLSPVDGYDVYDAMAQHYSDDRHTDKRYIIETKIRNVSFNALKECKEDGWILESKKLNSLIKVADLDKERNDILYISFNNDQTIVWNLTKLIDKGLLVKSKKVMNKATMESREDKVNKSIYLLKEEWGKCYKYRFDEISYKAHINKEEELKDFRKKDIKRTVCIFNEALKN
jgi:hypothetical protein